MKRLSAAILPCIAIAGFVIGFALSPAGKVLAQSDSRPGQPGESAIPAPTLRQPVPLWADQPTKCNYWSIDDIRKAHTEMAEKAAKLVKEAGSGSSQSFGGGPVHVQTRNFSMFMLYRMFRDKPVLSLTKVNSVLDDAEQHAGAYDFYIFTGGTGEMILGGKIANRQNLQDKDGIIPGEYRGQPVVGGQAYKVKPGDWLLIPPDTPHQPKPDPGGFSYFIMKINVGVYPWSLIR